jgi:hypothetical protein
LASFFGGPILPYKGKQFVLDGVLTSRQDFYRWIVHGTRARGIMMTLYSFMSPKRKEEMRKALDLKQKYPVIQEMTFGKAG